MNWQEFQKARLLMAEERVGARVRAEQTAEQDAEDRVHASSKELLTQRGMVA